MKIIPFDIEKAKSGKYKIQTKDGKPVRIICWDKKTIYDANLIGLVDFGNFEIAIYINESDDSLVLVDESAPSIRQQIYDTIIKAQKDYPSLKCATQLSAVVLADFIQEELNLPKWKRIHKGERLPEISYTKSDFHAQSYMPCMKGVEIDSDCWYLPVTALNELENEEL